jgi:pyruvate dehydrogenase E1 component beta subunit
MTYADAMIDALRLVLQEDPNFSLMGNEILGIGPEAAQFAPLQRQYPDRIFFPPCSEGAFVALAAGAAMSGHRIFAHLGLGSFAYMAFSSIANEVAGAHYASNGRIKLPFVMHICHGVIPGGASQHNESPQSLFWNIPGIRIAIPSGARAAKGLIRTACRSEDPVMVITHAMLYGAIEDVPGEDYAIPFGVAEILRPGRDVTLVATSRTVASALAAAESLEREGIEIEVIDPRTLVPFDRDAILASVARTGRVVIADETRLSCGVASEISAIIAEQGFAYLKAPILRVARPDAPVSASPLQEAAALPGAETIIAAIRTVVGG